MKRGFTLVELILSISLLAIVMYSLISIYITTGLKGSSIEIYVVAQTLAEGKMEECLIRSFDLLIDQAQTNYSGDLSQYSSQITITYVASSDLNSNVAGPTDYKRVAVFIRHPKLGDPVEFDSIRSNY
ncbi:MAG: prepilin-type N-terminal cleavage/methylation domain-containing protein [Candidatus Margulisiibacteriota bacterium]|jgi:prepilin-type N-terminal cleavage/methylation domain-containing protein